MSTFAIRKGFDIPLAGKPQPVIDELSSSGTVAVLPLEYLGIKQRLLVEQGVQVKRGSALIEDKQNTAFKICAPAAGTVRTIERGARRFVERIVIDTDADNEAEAVTAYTPDQAISLERTAILDRLAATGYLAHIRQRPFSGIASPEATPKSIFVNGMNTAPFLADAAVVIQDDPDAFQMGLNLMTRLTSGAVHVCLPPSACDELQAFQNVNTHVFSGPHPSGNTSVHISRIDPMAPHDVVWEIHAADLVQLGRLFLDGALPKTRIISVGGPGVRPDCCKHYRAQIGQSLGVLQDRLLPQETRIIAGNALAGVTVPADGYLPFLHSSLTVLNEDRERRFMGWTMPGFDQFSTSRLLASSWLPRKTPWPIGTNVNGGKRALIMTGQFDRIMPLNIMVDYLLRAVLAGDTDEAIELGILETAPEDFALCDFICPSKTEVQSIIRKGLAMIEEEGI